MRNLSYGGGVQSTAALVLAAQGKIDYPTFLFCNVGDDSEHPDTLKYVREQAFPGLCPGPCSSGGYLPANGPGCLRRRAEAEPHGQQPGTCMAAVARWRTDRSRSSAPSEMAAALALGTPPPSGETEPVSEAPVTNVEAAPPPPIKKTRGCKKAEAPSPEQESGSMVQAKSGETPLTPLATPSKRGRRKKTADEARETVETEGKTTPIPDGNAPQASTDPETGVPPAKPKRTRRVGAHQPKRYPVGEPEIEQGV